MSKPRPRTRTESWPQRLSDRYLLADLCLVVFVRLLLLKNEDKVIDFKANSRKWLKAKELDIHKVRLVLLGKMIIKTLS